MYHKVRAIMLAVALAASATGAVEAYPQCAVWVQRHIPTKHHTKATLRRWAAWNKTHPHYKPHTVQDTLAKYDIACTPVDTVPVIVTDLIPEVPVVVPDIVLEERTIVLNGSTSDSVPTLSYAVTPLVTRTPPSVPEPTSLLLLGTGLLCLGMRLKSGFKENE